MSAFDKVFRFAKNRGRGFGVAVIVEIKPLAFPRPLPVAWIKVPETALGDRCVEFTRIYT